MNISYIADSFKGTGIYPFNPRAICDAAYGPFRSSVIRDPENPLATAIEETHVYSHVILEQLLKHNMQRPPVRLHS